MRLAEKADLIAESLPEAFWNRVISDDDNSIGAKHARKAQKIDNGIDMQSQVSSIPSASWQNLYDQMIAKQLLTPEEIKIMKIAVQMPNKIPSVKQSRILVDILEKGRSEGMEI
jgi:hypothetical protein